MIVLPADEAYRRWAATYDHENVVTTLECELIALLTPSPQGLRLLDVGCGTGRRLVATGAEQAVGVEPCAEMRRAGKRTHRFGPEVRLLEGDARALPLPAASFDLVWCRLMIGHLPECEVAYRELGRVVAPGGQVIVTDFHADAYRAGLKRSFRDGEEVIEVAHHVHGHAAQTEAAGDAGLTLLDSQEGRIGPAVRHFYEAAGLIERFEGQCGMPIVSGLAFTRP